MANYIIGKASEGEASLAVEEEESVIDPMTGNKTISNLNKTLPGEKSGPVLSSDGFKRTTTKVIKIDKNDQEVKEYLKSLQNKTQKVMLSKFTQTSSDPIRMLIGAKDKLPEMNYGHDIIKRAIDILLRLLGYKSLDQMQLDTKKGGAGGQLAPGGGKKDTKIVVPTRSPNKKLSNVDAEPFTYDSSPDESPDGYVDNDPSIYPPIVFQQRKQNQGLKPKQVPGGKFKPSGPNNKGNSPPPQRYDMQEGYDDDDYNMATTIPLKPANPNAGRYTEKDMMEEVERFKQELGSPYAEGGEYEVYLSKLKIERELTLFKMFLNIKRR